VMLRMTFLLANHALKYGFLGLRSADCFKSS
jgi:hypothetical protein